MVGITGLRTRAQLPPISFLDSHAPLVDLHACVSERIGALGNILSLFSCCSLNDSDPRDIASIANISRILLQDVNDVFAVIQRRGLMAERRVC
ncbi:fructose-bisphosphate aldolase [Pseudomonas gingeri]|uniref:Fructose-bisphosphate aldolase n=1 Tax=Pseudomonas gingeri TaxID=117681 RepID=A0A7Y7WP22_9PSED|nr:fructose-bisphosphate aldolase [Pseudomonas gingeri]NWB84742.1 fructose-bisphosphate aldolase [Pseudomonas gingeri]